MKIRLVINSLLIGWLLTACAVEITDVTPVTPPELLVTPTPLATWTATPPPTLAGQEETPIPETPLPTGTPALQATEPISLPATPTPANPVSWADLALSGQLIFLNLEESSQVLVKLDLVSSALTPIFQPPDKAWLSDAVLSPDGQHIVMVYSPPPETDQPYLGYSSLYRLPIDGAGEPVPLFGPPNQSEAYTNPVGSPDGHYLYYTHFVAQAQPNDTSAYRLERMAYPGGQPEVLLTNAMWPSLSPDGSKLAYLALNPGTFTPELYVANADGTDPTLLVSFDDFPIIDAHFFSPTNDTIIFSAVGDGPQPDVSWLERWLGVKTASAHNFPSDWWRIPVEGGQPERLTKIYAIGLSGTFAPDGQYIAFIDLAGVYVMKPDGTEILQLLNTGASGTLTWLP